jgi:hypothetical protein
LGDAGFGSLASASPVNSHLKKARKERAKPGEGRNWQARREG